LRVSGNGRQVSSLLSIVVIDSGLSSVNRDNAYLKSVGGVAIAQSDDGFSYNDEFDDTIGHGTIVVNLLLDNVCTNINLFVIKIFDSSLSVDVKVLAEALRYCYENLKCDLVQISLGTLHTDSELKKAVDCLAENGTVIVSAYDNESCISYPAAYENVIGVDVTPELRNVNQYFITEASIVDVVGADVYHRVKGLKDKRVIVRGSSWYCSYITACIINFSRNNLDKKLCIEVLKANSQAILTVPVEKDEKEPLEIKRAVVFPFNKEITSMAAFEHLLTFDVADYFDARQKGKVGRRICDLLPHASNKKTLLDIANLDWNDSFDTFICGHTGELDSLLGYDFLSSIVEKCNEYGKHRFMQYSMWGRTLSTFAHMTTYFAAKEKSVAMLSNKDIFPVRTFELLSYRDSRLYLHDTGLLLEHFDSRILELCNGKNMGGDIAVRLGVDFELVKSRLLDLEDKMLVYGTVV